MTLTHVRARTHTFSVINRVISSSFVLILYTYFTVRRDHDESSRFADDSHGNKGVVACNYVLND